ncbi:MAG: insulinase family protein [Deltaproteobacteria bacterium]|jgi:zinc protease|nr:insulinase family protein [Deltaproteobacteria bacterium]
MSIFFEFHLKIMVTMVALTLGMAIPEGIARAAGEESYVLPNGLKVILAPREGMKVVDSRVMVKAGSASETGRAEHGLAHLMEHMAFKGTSRRGVGEISKVIEAHGGDTNAYTSYDETVYYIVMPSESAGVALDLLSDMVFSPTYDPAEYAKEKEVVIEEIRMGMDNPNTKLDETFLSDSFTPEHPYGHRVIGWPETVENASRDTALAFHDKFYRPDNCVLVISGGFDPEEIKALVDKYFKDFQNPAAALPGTGVIPMPRKPPKIQVLRDKNAKVPKLLAGFLAPSGGDSLAPTADLLSSVLSSGRSSRFEENIKNAGLATSVDSTFLGFRRGGTFVTSIETERDKVIPAFKALIAELNALPTKVPAADEIDKSRALASRAFVDGQETPWALGAVISNFELHNDDYRIKDAYLTIWSKLGSRDLVNFAKSVFASDNLTVTLLLPEEDEAITPEELLAVARELNLPEPAADAAADRAAFGEHVLSNGVRVLALRDPSLPKVVATAGFLAGRFSEEKGKEGVNALMVEVWPKATVSKSSKEVSSLTDSLGLRLVGSSGNTVTGLETSFLSKDLDESLALFLEILKEPSFPEEDFLIKKEEQLDLIRSEEESLSSRAFKLFRKNLFRGHPFAAPATGTAESAEKLKRDDLTKVYAELARPENMVFAIAGDINVKEVLDALEAGLGTWKPAGTAAKVALPDSPGPLKGVTKGSIEVDSSQSHLILGFMAPNVQSPDRAPVEVLNSILSGMGGILFRELRDQKSLAYSVTSVYSPSKTTGYFAFYIGTAPEKSVEAMTGILEIAKRARDETFDLKTVEDAKNRLIGLDLMSHLTLRVLSAEASGFALTDLPLDFNDKRLEAVRGVTPEDVRRVAKKYLTPGESVLTVVGNAESIKKTEALFDKF